MEILSTGIRNPPEQQLGEAQSVYQRQISDSQLHHPQWGIILGTGMGGVADSMDDANSIPYEKLPGFSRSTISGHRGELLAGRLNGVPIIALNGRCHFYEGRSAREILFPVWLLHSLGIKNLLIGNASGGINPFFNSGEVMLIDDHLDLMFRSVPSSEILDDGV